MSAVWWVIGIVAVLGVIAALLFNGMVRRRNRTAEAWAQIDVELKRRHDLIPRLVSTVQAYATHERSTFTAVTTARASAVAAGQSGDRGQVAAAENALGTTLRSLFAVAENYPELKAVSAFRELQEELTATEDKLEFARRYYNTSARDYNTAIQSFPRSLVATSLGFRPVAYFDVTEADRAAPEVSFEAPQP